MAFPKEQRSLFGEILDWMLAPLLLLWPMSLGLTGVVAQEIANRPYDRDLGESAQLLARQVQITPGRASGDMARVSLQAARALDLLRFDDTDKVYSLHEPQVYCLSKGKERKKYEFGAKALMDLIETVSK